MTDFRKMLEQEPEFQKFCEETIYQFILKASPEVFPFLYSMWQIGSLPKDVAQVMDSMNKYKGV